jgi:hypothetical protein
LLRRPKQTLSFQTAFRKWRFDPPDGDRTKRTKEDEVDDSRIGREAAVADLSVALLQSTSLFGGNRAMLDQWSAVREDLAQVITARLMRNLDLMRALFQWRNPAELVEAQLRWVQSLFDDYAAEPIGSWS